MAVIPAAVVTAASRPTLAAAAARGGGARQPAGAAVASASFCARMPLATVSSIVGHPVQLIYATAASSSRACVYHWGTGAAVYLHTITVFMVTRGGFRPITAQERTIATQYGKSRAHCRFARVASLGPQGFAFQCAVAALVYTGAETTRGAVGFSVTAMGGLALSREEHLLRLATAAG